jgi:hypothetical protein
MDWWRDWSLQWTKPGSTLLFPATVCEVVWDGHAVPNPELPVLTAPLAVDPTFDPPADRLPDAEVPSLLDQLPAPPPTRKQRLMVRLALLAWAALIVVGFIDNLWGGRNKGFGVWLFDIAGLIAGVYFGVLIYRSQVSATARGELRAPVGRTPIGAPGMLGMFLFGMGFLLAGLVITGNLAQDPPENAPAREKKRIEVRTGEQTGLAPILVLFGGMTTTFAVGMLAKTIRRQ